MVYIDLEASPKHIPVFMAGEVIFKVHQVAADLLHGEFLMRHYGIGALLQKSLSSNGDGVIFIFSFIQFFDSQF